MPSRRRLLAAAGTAVAGGAVGCVLRPDRAGHLQLKAVSLRWTHDGRTHESRPLNVLFDVEDRAVTGRYGPRLFEGVVRAADEIVVPDATHDRLTAWFDVTYAIGVCGSAFADEGDSDACLNAGTDHDGFNSVQLNDRVRVRRTDATLDVVGVSEDEYAIEAADIQAFDFLGQHADDGLDADDW